MFKACFRQLLAQSSEVLQDSSFHENHMNSSKRGYVTWLSPFILHSFHLALAWIGSKMLWLQYLWFRLLPTLCCSFATNNCTKRKPWNTLFLDFHSAFPWLSEAYSRWDAFLHHAKPRCSKAVRMLKPRDIRNQVRWMTSIYVPVFKDFCSLKGWSCV